MMLAEGERDASAHEKFGAGTVSLKLQLGRAACGPASKDVSVGGMGMDMATEKPPWTCQRHRNVTVTEQTQCSS
ncbi:hypothetical protein A1F94_007080 [Pyrenophora tritici-repentis]|nr:hypothetical protein A1F94_007080 [Pyrenophora tritici-repentis]